MINTICYGDNLKWLKRIKTKSIGLIYIDPPYNTGIVQKRSGSKDSYNDSFDDFKGFMVPRLKESYRVLADNGSLFLQIDYREVHYVKIWLDKIFGRENFINQIIWAYDYGARSKKRWSSKHDVILWYAKDRSRYIFNYDKIDRIPYLAPGLCGPEKAAIGKTPTDVWWNTIVAPGGKERTGYPTQKPLSILRRILSVHSNKKQICLDFFAGSGSFGAACLELNRKFILIDENPQAIKVMKKRLGKKGICYLS